MSAIMQDVHIGTKRAAEECAGEVNVQAGRGMVDVSTPTPAKKCRTGDIVKAAQQAVPPQTSSTAAPFSSQWPPYLLEGSILAESAQTELPAGTTAQTERPPSAAGSASEWPTPDTPDEPSDPLTKEARSRFSYKLLAMDK